MDTEELETRVHVYGQKKIEMDFFFGWESREINLRHTFLFKEDLTASWLFTKPTNNCWDTYYQNKEDYGKINKKETLKESDHCWTFGNRNNGNFTKD